MDRLVKKERSGKMMSETVYFKKNTNLFFARSLRGLRFASG